MRAKRLQIQVTLTTNNLDVPNFNLYGNFISNLFLFYLPEVIGKTRKLNVEFSEDVDALFIFPNALGESIYTIRETLNFTRLYSLSDVDKLISLTESVYQCLRKLYTNIEQNLDDLNLGYNLILKNNYKLNLKLAGGIKKNRSKNFKAVVTADYFLNNVLIQTIFYDKCDKVINKVPLFETVPTYYFYDQLVSFTKWVSNDVFQISNNTKEFMILINVNGSYEVQYSPQMRHINGLKEEILFLTKTIFIDL